MATLVVNRPDLFPAGTVLTARVHQVTPGAAATPVVESQTVGSDGKATFSTLADATRYVVGDGTRAVTQWTPAAAAAVVDQVARDAAGTKAPAAALTQEVADRQAATKPVELFEVVGDSWGRGFGPLAPSINGAAAVAARELDARNFRQLSIDGAVTHLPYLGINGAAGGHDGGAAHVLSTMRRPTAAEGTRQFLPASQLVAVLYSLLNDLASSGSLKLLPTSISVRTIVARAVACLVDPANAASWSRTGTWTQFTDSAFWMPAGPLGTGPGGIWSTNTVGDKATWTGPIDTPAGRVLQLVLGIQGSAGTSASPASPPAASTYGVKINGTSMPDVTVDPATMTPNDPDTSVTTSISRNVLHTVRYGRGVTGDPLLPSGVNTMEVTLKSGSQLWIDSAGIEADPTHGPALVIADKVDPLGKSLWNIGFQHGPGAATDPMTTAGVNLIWAAVLGVLGEFAHPWEQSSYAANLSRATADWDSAGAHMLDANQQIAGLALAAAGRKALARLSSPRLARYKANTPPWQPIGRINGPAFVNGWVPFALPYLAGTGSDEPAFRRNPAAGRVEMRGAVKSGTAATVITTIPASRYGEMLPRVTQKFNVASGTSTAVVSVAADGTVKHEGGGANTEIRLDGISWDPGV